jgi:hypothetical protein
VSTRLNKVWNKLPTLAGIAICLNNLPIGLEVKFNFSSNFTSIEFF